jgi:hypothetical protein
MNMVAKASVDRILISRYTDRNPPNVGARSARPYIIKEIKEIKKFIYYPIL